MSTSLKVHHVDSIQPGTLEDIAEAIANQQAELATTMSNALEMAIEIGGLLVSAKEICSQGEWAGWLERNFSGAPRTARQYMTLYDNSGWLAKRHDRANLTITSARKAISDFNKKVSSTSTPLTKRQRCEKMALSLSKREKSALFKKLADDPDIQSHLDRKAKKMQRRLPDATVSQSAQQICYDAHNSIHAFQSNHGPKANKRWLATAPSSELQDMIRVLTKVSSEAMELADFLKRETT